ncbi:hypothetical protein C6Y14_01185 [Streptomyces dioscori]|uniref:Uncharacterized protein n=1 Tax=Streptomyces dioscori TaxID=2109333 RepID=A0A2P8QEU3_9ACTN|nr:hypothetical protein [Streptomyces dioscori]PSM44773.1 hypothetical protein C6Y14_01185 [Streptomyces dioscori]
MLLIDKAVYGHETYAGARAAVFRVLGEKAPAEGSTERALLGLIVFIAASATDTFELQDVMQVYDDYKEEAAEAARQTAADREWCLENMKQHSGMASKMNTAQRKQETSVAALKEAGTVLITRGTSPAQTRKIIANGTFGGLPLNPLLVDPPSDAMATAQTGLGLKDTTKDPIEEWSLNQLQGFALDGFLLIAQAHVNRVTLPTSDAATVEGEAGVCGYAAAGLIGVLILQQGESSGMPAQQRELERKTKWIGYNKPAVVNALKAAANKNRNAGF